MKWALHLTSVSPSINPGALCHNDISAHVLDKLVMHDSDPAVTLPQSAKCLASSLRSCSDAHERSNDCNGESRHESD
jgi:hypothetical protein